MLKYSSVDDAIARANNTDYGLGGSVWTSDPENAGNAVAGQIESDMVWVNDHMSQHPTQPFGGIKSSGIGWEGGGKIGLSEFVDKRTVKVVKNKK